MAGSAPLPANILGRALDLARFTVRLPFIVAPLAEPARGLWREVQQCSDGPAGLVARAQFQHLAQQHQHGDDSGGLKGNGNGAAHLLEARRQKPRR